MIKGKGYAWGLSSVILASGFCILPGIFINPDSWAPMEIVLPYVQVVWIFFPVLAFALAFIGKVRSEPDTKARRCCNIGAGMGWILSGLLMFIGFGALWKDVVSLPETAAEITALIDTLLMAGYLVMAYIRSKILWFI